MALLYRKKVRDAIVALLNTSFNDKVNAFGASYGVSPFQLDFSNGSSNFRQEYVGPSQVEQANFSTFPAGAIYGGKAQDQGTSRGLPFDGTIQVCIDFYVRDRSGVPATSVDDYLDATEDAALSIINNPANQWPVGVILTRRTSLDREHAVQLGDGYGARIAMTFEFLVKVTSL